MARSDPTAAAAAPARSGRSRLPAADRRASIVAAAAELFAEVGYQRCRVSDVAARLGVTEPVVFQNFGSKAGLYAAVVDDAAQTLVAGLRSFRDAGVPVPDALGEILAPGHVDRMHAQGSPGVLFADAVALTAEPAIEEAARRGMRQVARALTELVAEGQARGEVAAGVDPEAAAWAMLSLIASHRFRTVVMPHRRRLEPQLTALFLSALGVER